MGSLKKEVLKQAMGFEGWTEFDSGEWSTFLRALRESVSRRPITTKVVDALRGGSIVMGFDESGAKSK